MGLNDAGVPGRNLPAMLDEAHVMRRIKDIERAYMELVASTKVAAGSLGNDALTSPVTPGVGGNVTSNFALTATATDKTSVSIPIPAGFTKALVHVTAEASALQHRSRCRDPPHTRCNHHARRWRWRWRRDVQLDRQRW